MTIFLSLLLKGRPHRHALLLIATAVLLVLGGGVAFAATQHLPVTTGWYWAVSTATTVGYGDVTPHNASGRLVASIVMLTTIPLLAAAFALLTGSAVASGLRRLLQMGPHFPTGAYRVVLGLHPSVLVVLEELDAAGEAVVLVANTDSPPLPDSVHFIQGDPTTEAVISAARPADAEHILIACDDDGDSLVAAVLVREEAPGVPVTALVSSDRLSRALTDLGVQQIISPDDLVGHTIAKTLEAPHAGALLMHLVRGEHHRLAERPIDPQADRRRLSDVRASERSLVLGVVQSGSVSLGVGDDPEVGPGDILLVVEQNGDRMHRRRHGAGTGAAAGAAS